MKGLFTEPDVRSDIMQQLICPDPDWGPSLPEIRRKYSYDVRLGNVDPEDVFTPEDSELTSVKSHKSGNGYGYILKNCFKIIFYVWVLFAG